MKLQALACGVVSVAIAAAQSATALRCESCHAIEAASQPETPMAQALARAADARILKENPDLKFASGGYTYRIQRSAGGVNYSVSGPEGTFTAPLVWAFGFGEIGQTYLYSYRGDLYESKVSYYKRINGLDFTIGQRRTNPANAEQAAGRLMSKTESDRCFGCHTTSQSPKEPVAGVQCERCHANSQRHASAIAAVAPAKLSKLSKDGVSDFCGGCHRTFQDIMATRTFNINNVRSQPYRLATSKCYSATQDKRISCVGCHDPHRDLEKTAEFYDAKCRACHAAGMTKVCTVASRECVSCHMPKVDFPDGHSRFTDHRIQVVRPGVGFQR